MPSAERDLDHSRPCGWPINRPKALMGKRVPKFGTVNPLACNRPTNHTGRHVCYSAEFVPLAEGASVTA